MSFEELKNMKADYVAGFFAGENNGEFCEDASDDWKKGYADGAAQAFDDCPEDLL